jgi:hypothetical protein
MLVNKRGVHFLKVKTHPKNVINRRTHARTWGGGGAPARLRSFYIIITPHITFFAILPPSWGVACAWLLWGASPTQRIIGYPQAPHTAWPRIEGMCL